MFMKKKKQVNVITVFLRVLDFLGWIPEIINELIIYQHFSIKINLNKNLEKKCIESV